MQSKRLAQWLQDHTDMLGSIENKQDNAFHRALYEGLIDVAVNGDTRMVDSVVESAAAHAVAVGRELTSLLGVHQRLRQHIWDRIGQEIDPEPAFEMLSALDGIFVHVIRVTIDAYLEGTKLALAAKSAEISRLYTDAEQKVMQYATEVSRANRELARLEQAKTDFISIAAHELKTPLTLIQGYVNFLQDMELADRARQMTDGINQGVRRMNTILNDMLDLSAMDMGRLKLVIQPVSVAKTIRLVVGQAEKTLAQREQLISVVGLDDLPEIEADATRLHQILQQLLSNAIKYTPNGGQITITSECIDYPFAGVKVSISDTGVGIAPENRDKVFEKFFRAGSSAYHSTSPTKFMGAGPGLGLAIVRGLVEAHGGRISADSPGFDLENCPGSKFILELPLKVTPPSRIEIEWLAAAAALSSPEQPALSHVEKDTSL